MRKQMSRISIDIDFDKLSQLDISLNQYIYLNCLIKGIEPKNKLFGDITELESIGYVKFTEDGPVLRERAYELFEISNEEKCWLEFFNNFPLKAGARPLRAKSLEAKDSLNCKKKYLRIIAGKPHLHAHILKCLDTELRMRKISNSVQYMNSMEPWLNQQIWEKYEGLTATDQNTDKTESI